MQQLPPFHTDSLGSSKILGLILLSPNCWSNVTLQKLVKLFWQERIFGLMSSSHGPNFQKSGLFMWPFNLRNCGWSAPLYLRLIYESEFTTGREQVGIKWKTTTKKSCNWMAYVTKTFWFSITLSKNNGAQNTLELTNKFCDFWRMQEEKD